MLPPGIASLAGQHAPPTPPTHGGGLSVLQDALDGFPALLHALSDPKDVHDAVTAMRLLTGIQARLMGPQGQAGGPAQAQR